MAKKTVWLLLFGFALGGAVALWWHLEHPTPVKREDGSWGMPLNPFTKASIADWESMKLTARVGDDTDTVELNWHIDQVQGEKVHRHIELEGERSPTGIFSNVTAPSIEEFIGMEPGVIADVAFAKTTRKVKDREFPCVKVSFTIHGDDGEWVKEELFVSKEIKGTGLVAWKINFMDWLFVDLDLAGFGSKEKVEWGDKLDTTRTAVMRSSSRYGEVMKAVRTLLTKRTVRGIAPARARAVEAPTDEVLIDLRDGTTTDALVDFAKRHKLDGLRWASHDASTLQAAFALARVAPDREAALLKELAGDPLVESAEHNLLFTIPDQDSFAEGARDTIPEEEAGKPRDGHPNDALFDKQWHMRMIKAPEAWQTATGKGVIVGVIDTGVAYTKKKGMLIPDLEGTKFVEGYDFVNDTNIAADDHGHGSHCAGTIAQTTHNGRGCSGVAPGATIMPIKVLSRSGSGTLGGVVAGIRFGADHGCKVLSLSLGGGGYSKVMADAVKYAFNKGCVVVCAAGNSGRGRVEYPAAYEGALAVSSVGPSGQRAFYSSYGPEIWVAAPGGDKSSSPEHGVLQNTIEPGATKSFYGFWQGTSMATPHVAGVAALLIERGVTDPAAVMKILASTATKDGKTGQGRDKEYGHGIIDANGAVKAAGAPDRTALVVVAVLVVVTFLVIRGRGDLEHVLVGAGGIVGACGLGFFGLGSSLPFFAAFPEWGGGNPLFASAAIPFFIGLVSVPKRSCRSLAVGLMLGSAAHLLAMAAHGYTAISWIPLQGYLDRAWLAANGLFLIVGSAMVVRLARGKGVA
ncbi:MAG: S8 family peptidase [Planctomycetota bacterium]